MARLSTCPLCMELMLDESNCDRCGSDLHLAAKLSNSLVNLKTRAFSSLLLGFRGQIDIQTECTEPLVLLSRNPVANLKMIFLLFGAIAVVVLFMDIGPVQSISKLTGVWFSMLFIPAYLGMMVFVYIYFSPRWDFVVSDSYGDPLVEIKREKRFDRVHSYFTVEADNLSAQIKANNARKKWQCRNEHNKVICKAAFEHEANDILMQLSTHLIESLQYLLPSQLLDLLPDFGIQQTVTIRNSNDQIIATIDMRRSSQLSIRRGLDCYPDLRIILAMTILVSQT